MPFRLLRASQPEVSFQCFDSPEEVPLGGYAVLSHVWRDKEPSYDTVVNLQAGGVRYDHLTVQDDRSMQKLSNCYRLTKDYGLAFFWTDAPCIDQRNSSELSEAIASMYHWYSKAAVCFAHLRDVPSSNDLRAPNSAFRNSVYFTRGWTLQELIAPRRVIFIAEDWAVIGEKDELADLLEEITGIDADVLACRRPVSDVSVARRLSWAARRKTRRVEDEAYCLMGLFGIHMPILYGEGRKAFLRLQQTILSEVCDHTLFAWGSAMGAITSTAGGVLRDKGLNKFHGGDPGTAALFAPSPAAFLESGEMTSVNMDEFVATTRALCKNDKLRFPRFSLDHHGVDCHIPVICSGSTPIAALLACRDKLGSGSYIALPLQPQTSSGLIYAIRASVPQITLNADLVQGAPNVPFNPDSSPTPRLLRLSTEDIASLSRPSETRSNYGLPDSSALFVSYRRIHIEAWLRSVVGKA